MRATQLAADATVLDDSERRYRDRYGNVGTIRVDTIGVKSANVESVKHVVPVSELPNLHQFKPLTVKHFTEKIPSVSYTVLFGSHHMDMFERLVANAKHADLALLPRLKAAARKLPKVVQSLERKKRKRTR
jgi:hypothetical protein